MSFILPTNADIYFANPDPAGAANLYGEPQFAEAEFASVWWVPETSILETIEGEKVQSTAWFIIDGGGDIQLGAKVYPPHTPPTPENEGRVLTVKKVAVAPDPDEIALSKATVWV